MNWQKNMHSVMESVSRELRAPGELISGAAEVLGRRKNTIDPEMIDRLSETLNRASVQLNHLTDQVDDLSRIQTPGFNFFRRSCRTEEILESAVNQARTESGHRGISLSCAPGLPMLFADPEWFAHALLMIIRHAVQTTASGSRLRIEVTTEDNPYILIEMTDHPTEGPFHSIHRVFDHFCKIPGTVSTEPDLGLTLARHIIEAHRGILFIKDREGGGTFAAIVLEGMNPE